MGQGAQAPLSFMSRAFVSMFGSGALLMQAESEPMPSWVPSPGNYIALSAANTMRDVYGADPNPQQQLLTVMDNWNSGLYARDDGPRGALYNGGSGHGNRVDAIFRQALEPNAADCNWSIKFPLSPLSDFTNAGDGDVDGGIGPLADHPTPPHTYDTMVYIPADAFGNAKGAYCYSGLMAAGDDGSAGDDVFRSWFLDLDTGLWSKSSNTVPGSARGNGFGSAVYDPVAKCVWYLASGFPTDLGKLQNLSSTRDWTSIAHGNGSLNTDLELTGGYCPPRDCFVWWWSGGATLIVWTPNAGRTSGTLTWNATQAGTAPASVVGLEWCSHGSVQKFYGMEFVVGTFYPNPTAKTLTPPASLPGTWTWGSETFTAQGGAGAIGNVSLNPRYNALRWCEPLKCFAWANNHQGATNFLRPAAAT